MYSCVQQFLNEKDTIICSAFDTETDGLHIIYNKPFVFQCGWVVGDKGYAFSVDLEAHPTLGQMFMVQMNALFTTTPIHLGHNVKFDLHMCINYGAPYRGHNISDTQSWIRLGSEAVPQRKGGVPLALKDFCAQYITRDAKNFESKLAEERTMQAKEYNARLVRYLGWKKGKIDEFFKDKVHDVDDLPADKRDGYYKWLDSLPDWLRSNVHGAVDSSDILYNKLDRPTLLRYAGLDVTWTCEVYLRMRKVVENHGNLPIMDIENRLIPILVESERAGMPVDLNYLIDSRNRLKEYILRRREDLRLLAGEDLKCSQSLRIKQLCADKFGHPVESTASEELGFLISDLKRDNPEDPIIEFLETIQELRTLEKWYATYILQYIKDIKPEESKLYTSFNASGTVSGRYTCNLQQFPKKGIVDIDGNELFNPRKMVTVPKEASCFVYEDFSALELRCQAMFTVHVMGGDLNMCRAYMPFKCHRADGTKFDYNNLEHKKAWNDGEWYQDEDEKKWEPTDLHGATTKMAFDMDGTEENFHDMRYVGKRVNFAKNYGGSFSVIKSMFPEFSEEQLHKIDDAYYAAFPGVKEFHKWVKQRARESAYLTNLYGCNYWGSDAHHLCNMLVQGTGAYHVKIKQIKLDEYIKKHHLKSKMILSIHDEIVFQIAPGEEEHVWQFRKILEEWDEAPVPMVCDIEATRTNWYEKQEFPTEEEFLEWIKSNG